MQISGIISKIKMPILNGGLFTAILTVIILFSHSANATSAVIPSLNCSECSDDVLEHSMPTNFTAADGKTYSNCNALCRAYQTFREDNTTGEPNEYGVYVYNVYTYGEICGTWNPGTQMGALGQCFLVSNERYKCGLGYYGNATSATSGCTKCPANATCTRGTGFDCNSGWYENTAGNGCSQCPPPDTGTGDKKNWTVGSSYQVGKSGGIIVNGPTGAQNIGQCYLTNTSVVTDNTGTYEIEGATGGGGLTGPGKYCDYYGRY